MRLSSLSFLLILWAAHFIGKCEAVGILALLFRGLLNQLLPRLTLLPLQISLLNSISAVNTNQSLFWTLQEGDVISRSSIINASDLYVEYRSIFVRQVQIQYTFQNTNGENKMVETLDSTVPYSLFGTEESAPAGFFSRVGPHSVMITPISWWNISVGDAYSLQWTVVSAPVIAPVTAPVLAPVTAPVIAPVTAPVVAPVTAPVIAPVTAPVLAPVTSPIVAPVTAPVIAPVTAPVVAPVTAPVIAPVNAPVVAPVTAPVIAPVTAPVVAPNAPSAPVPKTPVVAPTISVPVAPSAPSAVRIVGELRIWHKLTLVFLDGPETDETATPNPFTEFRLDVEFRNGNDLLTVPGYYAADGNAANTRASAGSVWHCHVAPTKTGTWTWRASFRSGPNVAADLPGSVRGSTWSPIDGMTGAFDVLPTDKTGVDLRGKGLLRYVEGKHHFQFAGNGEWFLKVGADSPENFLAYDGFDNTPNNGRRRKSLSPHERDFAADDPTWANGNGTGIIGAVNYLSNQGMRSFSFLTMNIEGDDENVYPYIDPISRLRFDVSKLAQWEVVFEHADRKGMYLHFKTQERENDQLLDSGALGVERKIYYRELIARFSHHLALNWNIGEENTNTVEEQNAFADWFKALDPYQHPVVIHTFPDEQELVYQPLYGYPSYDGASLQSYPNGVFNDTLMRIKESAAGGRTWVVANDEQGSADKGVVPDSADPSHDTIRRLVLWGNLMAGGAGVEYYFGYSFNNSDLTCQDFRSRANMWVQSRYALEFFLDYSIPFQDMSNENRRVSSNSWCLVDRDRGRVVVVYLRNGGSTAIDLTGLGLDSAGSLPLNPSVSVDWYDPRNGGSLQKGSVTEVQLGIASQSLGSAPNNGNKDWVVLLRSAVGLG